MQRLSLLTDIPHTKLLGELGLHTHRTWNDVLALGRAAKVVYWSIIHASVSPFLRRGGVEFVGHSARPSISYAYRSLDWILMRRAI